MSLTTVSPLSGALWMARRVAPLVRAKTGPPLGVTRVTLGADSGDGTRPSACCLLYESTVRETQNPSAGPQLQGLSWVIWRP